jgi:hypothetical protein
MSEHKNLPRRVVDGINLKRKHVLTFHVKSNNISLPRHGDDADENALLNLASDLQKCVLIITNKSKIKGEKKKTATGIFLGESIITTASGLGGMSSINIGRAFDIEVSSERIIFDSAGKSIRKSSAFVVGMDEETDLIELRGCKPRYKKEDFFLPLKKHRLRTRVIKLPVIQICHPNDRQWSIIRGEIRSINTFYCSHGAEKVDISGGDKFNGMYGGAVFTEEGSLIGIARYSIKNIEEKPAFCAIPTSQILLFMKLNKASLKRQKNRV